MALVDNAWYVDYGDGSTTGYFAVGAWATGAAKNCGNLIRATAPAVGSERVFVCIVGGTTHATTQPTWTNTRGAKNTDNTVTWQEATGIAALNGDLSANTPTWTTVKNTAITLGQVIQNVAGTLILICTTAGTAGNGAEPSWAAFTNAGATTADNTATWTTLGASFASWAAPHARLANAFTATWGQAGNSFFVASEHAETQNTVVTYTSPGTVSSPCNIYCVNKSNVPPGDSNLTTGATCSTTGASSISFGVQFSYFYGIEWKAGNGSSNANLTLVNTSNNSALTFKSCKLTLNSTGIGTINLGGSGGGNCKFILDSCTFTFSSVINQSMGGSQGAFFVTLRNCTTAGSAPSSGLFALTAPSNIICEGCDLSSITGTFVSTASTGGYVQLKDCKLAASPTFNNDSSNMARRVDVVRSDGAGTNYRSERYDSVGTLTTETTIIRTGGASDGTTGISWKLAGTSRSKWTFPLEAFPVSIFNSVTATNRTVQMFGICQLAALPNNDDTWFDVEYLGASGNPQGSFKTGTKASNLATGSALTADTVSDWTGQASAYQTAHAYGAFTGVIKAGNAAPQQLWFMVSHSGSGTSGGSSSIFNGQADGAQVVDNSGGNQITWQAMMRFSLTLTLSSPQPAQIGYLSANIKVAKASTTYWWDPLITLG